VTGKIVLNLTKPLRPLFITLAVYLITVAWILPNLIFPLFVTSLGDFEHRFAPMFLKGALPYRDFFFEYPPLFVLSFYLIGVLSAVTRLTDISAVNFFVAIPIFYSLYLLLVPRERFWSAWLLLLFLVVPSHSSFDYMPAVILVISLLLARRGWVVPSLVLINLAIGWKVIPIVLLPFIILLGKNWREKFIYSAFSAFLLALPYLVVSVLGGASGLLRFFSFHFWRGVQWESVPAIPYLIYLLKVGASPADIRFESVYDRLGSWVVAVFSLFFLANYFLLFKKWLSIPRRRPSLLKGEVFNLSALVLLLWIVTSKLLSPQYLIWYVLLLPFTDPLIYKLLYRPTLLVLVLTVVQFAFYPVPEHGNPPVYLYALPLLARNIILVISLIKYSQYFLIRRPKVVDSSDTEVVPTT